MLRRHQKEYTPRVPRSMTRDSDPVWRLRWNARSMLWRCSKVTLATRRIVFCVTCSKYVAHDQVITSLQVRESLKVTGFSGAMWPTQSWVSSWLVAL